MKEIDAAFTAPGNATCRVDATTSDSVGEGSYMYLIMYIVVRLRL